MRLRIVLLRGQNLSLQGPQGAKKNSFRFQMVQAVVWTIGFSMTVRLTDDGKVWVMFIRRLIVNSVNDRQCAMSGLHNFNFHEAVELNILSNPYNKERTCIRRYIYQLEY